MLTLYHAPPAAASRFSSGAASLRALHHPDRLIPDPRENEDRPIPDPEENTDLPKLLEGLRCVESRRCTSIARRRRSRSCRSSSARRRLSISASASAIASSAARRACSAIRRASA